MKCPGHLPYEATRLGVGLHREISRKTRATDTSDPKLRFAGGSYYLFRKIELTAGKNAIEISIDGERVRRVAYRGQRRERDA